MGCFSKAFIMKTTIQCLLSRMIDLYNIVKLVQGCVADDADSNLFAPHPI